MSNEILQELNDTSSFLNDFEEESIIKEGKEGVDDIINAEIPDDDGIKILTDTEGLPFNPEDENKQEDESTEDTEDKSEDEEGDKFSYKAFLSHLNDEGVIAFEDKEDLDDTPDLVYESVKTTIQEGIKSYKDSIPDEGKRFLDYLEKGGDPTKYIETLQKPLDITSLDLDSEADQERVMREYLKTQDYTSEEIDETIADYKEGLLLDKQSKVAAKKLEKTFEKRTQDLIKQQELEAESKAEQYNTYINTVSSTIDNSSELAGLEITKAEKDSFKKYLLARDKEGLTAYERAYQEDPVKTQLELAYLKFKNYDFASAKKKGESEATKKLNWKLQSNDKTVKGKSSVEVKDEDGSFDAFKAFLGKQK